MEPKRKHANEKRSESRSIIVDWNRDLQDKIQVSIDSAAMGLLPDGIIRRRVSREHEAVGILGDIIPMVDESMDSNNLKLTYVPKIGIGRDHGFFVRHHPEFVSDRWTIPSTLDKAWALPKLDICGCLILKAANRRSWNRSVRAVAPGTYVLDGGVSLMGPLFWDGFCRRVLPAFASTVEFVPAKRKENVVVIGALCLE